MYHNQWDPRHPSYYYNKNPRDGSMSRRIDSRGWWYRWHHQIEILKDWFYKF